MTCVWKGILDCLNNDDFFKFGLSKKPREMEFVKLLKSNNKRCKNVRWQGESLRNQFLDECFEAVKCFNERSINGGYFCSTCDPFLILVCEIFRVNISHKYCGHMVEYKRLGAVKTLRVKSNRGHFQRA